MDEFSIVHPWTLKWWQSLPAAYRSADAKQYALPRTYQVGLNRDPIFQTGSDGWVITAITQEADQVAAKLERTFTGVEYGKEIHVQVWWADPTPGAYLTIGVYGQSPVPIAQTTRTDFPTASGMDTVTARATAGTGAALTVKIELGGTVTEDSAPSLLTLDGISVGYTAVQYESLPGVIAQPAHPLLRFMDGPGRVAGEMRDISDHAWDGNLTNPATTPDHALPWLAQMLGAPTTVRELPREQLRTYLQDMATDGRPPAGTRQSVITAAKQFLAGEGQALIQPMTPLTPPHTIVMLVRTDQVPDGDLPALTAKIRGTGVIPAGHVLSIRMAITEWDVWEAAAGTTWDEVEANAKTWADADSLGIELEGP